MSKPKPNLAEVVAAAGSTRKAASAESPAAPVPAEKQERPQRRNAVRGGGTKQIGGHFPAEVSWQLRQLAVEERSTVQALLGEALNDLFQKHGKPEIVPIDLVN